MSDEAPKRDDVRPFRWAPLRGDGDPDAPDEAQVPAAAPASVRAYRWADLGPGVDVAGAGAGFDGTPSAVLPPAEAALAEARREAEAMLEAAHVEAEQMREAARAQGFAEGSAQGREALEEAAGRVQALVAELAACKTTLLEEAREQLLELALALTGRILGPLAAGDEQAVVRVVERALQVTADRENLTIRVHPEDLKSLVEAKPALLEAFDGIQKLTVIDDPSIRRGGCLVQTPTTEIDARLDSQLQELTRALRGA